MYTCCYHHVTDVEGAPVHIVADTDIHTGGESNYDACVQ